MKLLLDVNVLVAWGWMDHQDHERVARWIVATRKMRGAVVGTSAIHLHLLAQRHGLLLATLDTSVPEAFVIPGLG